MNPRKEGTVLNRQLEEFAAVVEEGSFTRAAVRLYVSQPSLSAQIARLERELGVRLLVREARGVAPTEAGRVFYEGARNLLEEYSSLVKATRTADGSGERLVFGGVGIPDTTVFGEMLFDYHLSHPETRISFELVPFDFPGRLAALRAGNVDVLICGCRKGTEHPGLSYLPIRDEADCLLVSRSDPLAPLERVTAEDLSGRTLIVPDEGPDSPGRAAWEALLAANPSITLRRVPITEQLVASLEFSGEAMLTLGWVGRAYSRLACIPLADQVGSSYVGLVSLPAKEASPVARDFMRYMEEARRD